MPYYLLYTLYFHKQMKHKLECLLQHAVETLKAQGMLDRDLSPRISVERTRDSQHGDFASNIALLLAKSANLKPMQFAERIVAAIPEDKLIEKIRNCRPWVCQFLY